MQRFTTVTAICTLGLLMVLLMVPGADAQSAFSAAQAINLMSMIESEGGTLRSLDSLGFARAGRFTFQGTYSASGWTYRLSDPTSTVSYAGSITSGTVGVTDVVVSFSGGAPSTRIRLVATARVRGDLSAGPMSPWNNSKMVPAPIGGWLPLS